MKKLILFGVFGLLMTSDSHALDWFKSWYGAGCQARWKKCGEWVQKNCEEGYGGCNGACVLFGIRGDCLPNDLQVSSGSNPLEPVYKNDPRAVLQRKKSGSSPQQAIPRSTYFDPPQKDLSAIQNGKYQVMEKGKVREVQLNTSQMQELGVKPVRPGVEGPVRTFNPALYE